ncbi:AAA family ATPase [Undibacterium sp. Tian12W]|uniref:AAA family ATPase n=1 Tax=Undibacterium sp. Tian12W TaxID=3413054 RepID=UPI003BF2028F
MRITDIAIPENGCMQILGEDLGIKSALGMPRLGQLVVLAGANGAGKSRLLSLIRKLGNYYGSMRGSRELLAHMSSQEEQVTYYENVIKKYEEDLRDDPTREGIAEQISLNKSNLEQLKVNIAAAKADLSKMKWFVKEPVDAGVVPVSFVPTTSTIKNAKTFSPEQLELYTHLCVKPGQGDTSETVPSYLLHTMRRARNSKLAKLEGTSELADEEAIKAGVTLEKLITLLLGENANLKIDRDDNITIFGRYDFSIALSDGQKVLLILAVQLHAQKTDLANALIFLDEPENHLHPAVLNQVIDVLLSEVSAGQIWIATHSVPLIARLLSNDPACVWFMKDGMISHAGKKPELVLKGLLGDEQEISRLRDFTDLPAKMAANRYAAECLLDPAIVTARTGDKQQVQMVEAINDSTSDVKLRVLDFGAGQGRLLAALRDAGKLDCVDYIAFDIEGSSNAICQREIEAAYGIAEVERRFFTDIADVITKWSEVDIVIMCNVFHEIPPEKWLHEIGSESRLLELIKSDGYLLIVEDQRIPVGENAHDYGFLVFNTLQFQKLFSFKGDVKESLYKKYDADLGVDGKAGRLLAHRFARSLVSQITAASQKEAIADLFKTAGNEMAKLRNKAKKETPSFQEGQLHAFWMTQYANATLWLQDQGVIEFK